MEVTRQIEKRSTSETKRVKSSESYSLKLINAWAQYIGAISRIQIDRLRAIVCNHAQQDFITQ